MKRKIYLAASWLLLAAAICSSFAVAGISFMAIGVFLIEAIALVLASLAAFLIAGAPFRGSSIEDPSDLILFPFGLLTIGFKKIFYSDLGYFWCWKTGSGTIHIFEQKALHMQRACSVRWRGEIEPLRREIKKELEAKFQKRIAAKRDRDLYKEWDGYVDKQSERADKISKLGV